MVNSSDYIPDVGDIIELDLVSQVGFESSGYKKQALVISNKKFNNLGFAVLCPIENKSCNPLYEVFLSENRSLNMFILYNQVRSIDWKKRNSIFKYKLPNEVVNIVKNRIGILL